VVSLTPVIVSGTVTPAGPPVTVELYRVGARGRRQLVASRSLAAAGGAFSARLKHPGAGRYVLIARTAATSRFAAGVSPPLSLTL